MKNVTTTPELSHSTTESNSHLFDDWFDPIETGIRDRVRGLIEEMIRGELDAALSRPRYGRQARHADGSDAAAGIAGHRHGSRARTLMGTFGKTEINVPHEPYVLPHHLGCDEDDRRTIAIGFIEAVDEVETTWAAGTGTGHELPSELPFRARREGAGLLVAHTDPLDLALLDGVSDAVKRVADDPVASLYAGCLQCFDQYVGHSLILLIVKAPCCSATSVCGRTTIFIIATKPRQTDTVAMRVTGESQEIIQPTAILLPSTVGR
jgi:hypothetical protein